MTDEELADLACRIVAEADAKGKPCRWVFQDSAAGRVVAVLIRRLHAERRNQLPLPDVTVDR